MSVDVMLVSMCGNSVSGVACEDHYDIAVSGVAAS